MKSSRMLKYSTIVPVSVFFFFSSRSRHTSFSRDWSSVVCSSDLAPAGLGVELGGPGGGVAAVVGEGRQRVAGAGVGGPAEVDRARLSGPFGDGGGAGL